MQIPAANAQIVMLLIVLVSRIDASDIAGAARRFYEGS